MVICLERDADLHMAQLMPLPLTVSCFSEVQIGFTFLVSAHPGSPGKRAIKRMCVCACVRACQVSTSTCVCLCVCRLSVSQQRFGGLFLELAAKIQTIYHKYSANHPSAVAVLQNKR